MLALVLIALSYVHPLRSYRAAQDRVAEREAELASLEREHTRLQHRLTLSGQEVFIEREARRFGLVHPGERLFIVKGVEAWRKAWVR